MKWYVLMLFLLASVVCSVRAQSMDTRLVGAWETYDGPCNPCILTIPASGKVTFTQVGDPIEVMYAQATPEPGITAQVSGLGTCTPVSRTPVRRRTEGEHANSPAARTDYERMEPWSPQARPRSCEGGGLCASSST